MIIIEKKNYTQNANTFLDRVGMAIEKNLIKNAIKILKKAIHTLIKIVMTILGIKPIEIIIINGRGKQNTKKKSMIQIEKRTL